ncbi:MAG: C4-type zinc ribbon domain-containing protein [Acidobacteriota bacterium]
MAERLARIPVEREQIENEFNQFAAEFLALKNRYEQTLKDHKQLEADLADTQQKHEKFQQDKMRVNNEKEYTAVLREIDSSKKLIGSLETEILKRMEELEHLESELKVQSPAIETKRGEVDASLASLDREREEALRLSVELENRRRALCEKLPKSLFSVYDRMTRSKRGQALSEIIGGVCTACRMKVRPKVFSDVRRGDQMITCESCGRILFYRNEPQQSAEMAMSNE